MKTLRMEISFSKYILKLPIYFYWVVDLVMDLSMGQLLAKW
jgi:hypothetical protein